MCYCEKTDTTETMQYHMDNEIVCIHSSIITDCTDYLTAFVSIFVFDGGRLPDIVVGKMI